MPIEILMPALSPTMEEGTLAKWLVKEGDTVASGDLLAEIETDKATMEFEAVDEGVIGKLLIAEGSEGVKVNTVIAVLLEEGESADDIAAASAPAASPAPQAAAEEAPAAAQTAAAAPPARDGTRIFASPLARRIAADKGLDLSQITGSGPHGRIVKADVLGGARAEPSVDRARRVGACACESAASPRCLVHPSRRAAEQSRCHRGKARCFVRECRSEFDLPPRRVRSVLLRPPLVDRKSVV